MKNPELEWIVADGLTPYPEALEFMEARVAAIHAGTAAEAIWLVEHPPLFTAGTSAQIGDLKAPDAFPVYEVGRGGQYTYHGPGQRVAYVMVDLNQRGRDVRAFIAALERWVVDALAQFNVVGESREGRVGIWIDRSNDLGDGFENKIAAIGVRLRKWISFHGLSINVDPNLNHFQGIVPCGISEPKLGVTSLTDLGLPVTLSDLDLALKETCPF